ncbi:MAG: transglutaminase domain-containing protein [Bacteroidota bacterium]
MLLHTTIGHAQTAYSGQIDFQLADSIAALYKGEKLTHLPLLSQQLTSSLPSEVEQFRAIYTWVCTNIENDYGEYWKNKKKQEQLAHDSLALASWSASFGARMYQKLLKRQKTICTGYAYLIAELAKLAGIECIIIDGYGRTGNANTGEPGMPNHSWNAVRLDDSWYLCDATWSSGHTNLPEQIFIPDYNDGYFLADPELFAMNHYPMEPEWLLMDHVPDFTDFLYGPLVYKHAFKHRIIPLEPARMDIHFKKNETVRFLLQAPKTTDLSSIHLELASRTNTYSVTPKMRWTEKGLLELTHRLDRRIHYDVHIKIGEQHIATYTARTKRN